MSGGNPTPEKRSKAVTTALGDGHFVVYGDPFTLQLDIDSKGAYLGAKALVIRFRERLSITRLEATQSKSKDHWHFYVRMSKPLCRADRLFWQVALGSDPVRGALDWVWMQDGHPEDCFLVEFADAEMKELEL